MRMVVGSVGSALVSLLQAHAEVTQHFHGLPDDMVRGVKTTNCCRAQGDGQAGGHATWQRGEVVMSLQQHHNAFSDDATVCFPKPAVAYAAKTDLAILSDGVVMQVHQGVQDSSTPRRTTAEIDAAAAVHAADLETVSSRYVTALHLVEFANPKPTRQLWLAMLLPPHQTLAEACSFQGCMKWR
jgi:hypothetical protein